jgi:hypothetical protein
MKNILLPAFILLAAFAVSVAHESKQVKPLPVSSLPDSTVYKLTRTSGPNAGELDVYCLNGADATVRPVDTFGHIVVSCGK